MNDLKGIIEDVGKSDLVSDKVVEQIINIIGQDKWNELNNSCSDICTTPGELLITLGRLQDIEESSTTGYFIVTDVQGKRLYYTGCKLGSGFVKSVYSAKIYKTKENAIKTILEHKDKTIEWENAFFQPVTFRVGY